MEVKSKVAILMDFDNWFPTILKEDDLSRLQQLLLDVLNIAIANMNEVDYITIGLYGGWYSEKILTPKASMLLTMIPKLTVALLSTQWLVGIELDFRIFRNSRTTLDLMNSKTWLL